MLGWNLEELIGKHMHSILHHSKPDGTPYLSEECPIYEALRGGAAHQVDNEVFLRKDGAGFPVRYVSTPIRERDKIVGAVVTFDDITKKIRSELEYKTIINTTLDGFWIMDTHGHFLDVNDAYCRLVGYSKDELMTMRILDVEAAQTTEEIAQNIQRIIKSGSARFETKHRHKDGRIIDIEVSVNFEKINGGRLFVFIRDIAERKQAEEKIKKFNSVLTSIREINENLLRIKEEKELFVKICDTLGKVGFIKFAWIGLIEKGNFDIKPIAHAGFEEGFLSSIKIGWDDSEYGGGHSATAIKTGKPVIVKDVENDPMCKPWRNDVKKLGSMPGVAILLKYDSDVIGVLSAYSDRKDAFGREEIDFLKEVAGDIAIGIKSLRQENKLAQGLEETKKALNGTIEALALMVEMRDPYTSGHEKRVAALSCAIAREMGFTEDRIEGVRISGFLHDTGKIVVPADILSKPTNLNEYEYGIIKTHPQVGYDVLKGLEFPWPVAQATLQHQERLDGSGYPAGLKGEAIIMEARILAIADVFEAMTNHRPYRPALGIDKALEEISRNKGVLYDPDVVDACVRLFKEKGFQFSKGV
jgi:PAS domain S-box-containing protein